jgi:hypothetical protein
MLSSGDWAIGEILSKRRWQMLNKLSEGLTFDAVKRCRDSKLSSS